MLLVSVAALHHETIPVAGAREKVKIALTTVLNGGPLAEKKRF